MMRIRERKKEKEEKKAFNQKKKKEKKKKKRERKIYHGSSSDSICSRFNDIIYRWKLRFVVAKESKGQT